MLLRLVPEQLQQLMSCRKEFLWKAILLTKLWNQHSPLADSKIGGELVRDMLGRVLRLNFDIRVKLFLEEGKLMQISNSLPYFDTCQMFWK